MEKSYELIKTFGNANFGKIRVALLDGEPMLCLADVCKVLDLTNPSRVKQRLKPKGITEMYTLTNGGNQKLLFIDQPNVYRAVFQSKKPEAEIISDWVVEEVLPSIFETGSYSLHPQDNYMLQAPKTYAEALRALADETEKTEALQAANKALESQVVVKDQQIAVMQPKASYFDVVINSPDLITTRAIAKDYGWSPQDLNKFLNNLGIQYFSGNRWYLYQQYADKGYTGTKRHAHPESDGLIHTSEHMYWTQKGRLFIYDTLKAQGIVPTMERPKQLSLTDYDFGDLWK